MSDTSNTTTNMVKKITIGTDSRFIAAKYDINGNEITSQYLTNEEAESSYLKISDANDDTDGYVKVSNLNSAVSEAINDMVADGELEVKAAQTKKICVMQHTSDDPIKLDRVNDKYGRHVVIKIYSSEVNSETGTVILDKQAGTTSVEAPFWKKGATFEIYDNMLFCTGNTGSTEVYQSTNTKWSTLDFEIDANFSVMIYDEDWDDPEVEEGGS